MATNPRHNNYTYADYLTYEENDRIEILDGQIYNMAPAPSRVHQYLIMEIAAEIRNYIKANKGDCEVYPAPFDVILKNNDEDITSANTVVQPDISVICDKNKLTDKGCTGSPDFIVEIVSPFNPSNDYVRKTYLYEKYGVREYWIVNPMKKAILVYTLNNGGYDMPVTYSFNDKVKVNIYNNLEIDFSLLDL